MKKTIIPVVFIALLFFSCGDNKQANVPEKDQPRADIEEPNAQITTTYATFALTTDLSKLSENEKELLPILIEAAKVMDGLFWQQSYGDQNNIPSSIENNDVLLDHYMINYGPWDRMDGDAPLAQGIDEKSLGAQFYPDDMSEKEFDAFEAEGKSDLYTLLKRDEGGALFIVPFHEEYKEELTKASELLLQAAALTEDIELKGYLELRAEALLNDDFDASDRAWLDMKNNTLDIVIGPIENYEDQLYGYKAAYEAYVLVKDKTWSEKLAKYAAMLPELQEGLPVSEKYKREKPGTDSQLNAYDVVYYAGHCNAGGKTIAVNLPNDETIQLEKGTRRSQLKNAMQAKFDKIMLPLNDVLIDEGQRRHVTFDAFFANTMFHEVAHGLGIKETINGKGMVRASLKDQASALEEGKADILGLYMVTELLEAGELGDADIMDHYVTFMAGIFRSVRFGASSAHGKANMLRFNFFKEMGAFTRNEQTGTYSVNKDKMKLAMDALSSLILTLQGNGDYEGVVALMKRMGSVEPELAGDLDRLTKAGIPVDIIFEQGVETLGL